MYTKRTLPEEAHLHVVRMIQSPLMDEKLVSNIQAYVKDDGSTMVMGLTLLNIKRAGV